MKIGKILVRTVMGFVAAVLLLVALFAGVWFVGTSRASGQSMDGFVGAQSCGQCHAEEFAQWESTAHAKAFQAVTPDDNPIVPAWEGVLTFAEGNVRDVSIRLEKAADGSPRAILEDAVNPGSERILPVDYLSGGHGWKQRYYTSIDGEHYILPMDWNQTLNAWTPVHLYTWWEDDGSLKDGKPFNLRTWGAQCAGCHETGVVTNFGPSGYQSMESSERYIGCEKCHGPGEPHVESPSTDNIINPSSLVFDRELESCGQCHSYGSSVPVGLARHPMKEFGGVMYRTGEKLDDYRKSEPILWEGTEYSKKHRQQFVDHQLSGHYGAELGCTACHDPHGSAIEHDLRAPLENGALCLSCHGRDVRFQNAAAIEQHTKHPAGAGGGITMACTTCHQQNATYSAAMGDGTSHHFNIVPPQVSLDMYLAFQDEEPVPNLWPDGLVGHNSLSTYLKHEIIPNSCNECHTEWKATREGFEAGVEAYSRKFL
jgi:predicted CXXCH cytochrome family protein